MKTLTLELTKKDSEDSRGFAYSLREAINQIENGFSSGQLTNGEIESGYWEISN